MSGEMGSQVPRDRARSSSVGSVDITESAHKSPENHVALQELRRRNQYRRNESDVASIPENDHVKPDLVEKYEASSLILITLAGKADKYSRFFLNSERPAVALFAISICLVGVMDFLPREAHDPASWSEELQDVNGFYGPGSIISWCLLGISMLYDANQVFKQDDNFHYLKYASLIFSGLWALGDAVWRALRTDFGPSYAAALYMSDKGFELATLLYTLHLFPVHRRQITPNNSQSREQPPDEERPDPVQKQPQSSVTNLPFCVSRSDVCDWNPLTVKQ